MVSISGRGPAAPREPEVQFTPDGKPTPEFLAWLKTRASSDDIDALGNYGLALS